MKRYLPFVIIALVFLGALGAGLALYRSTRNASPVASTQSTPQPAAPNMFESYSPHVRGGNNAPVTLEEYGDYQCPPCGALAPVLKGVEAQYGDRLRFVFRQYPLANHPHALIAAQAAEAAGLQGRFWEMHDRLYENQSKWSGEIDPRPLYINYARDVGLDVDRFISDMNGQQVKARVASDRLRGNSAGVTGTPTIFINGRMLRPEAMTPEGIRTAIDMMTGKPGK
ncbi:MAG TPA: thioredoxin domain-containing protein [Pyrinomonadaceae bacterium]|jgi:protein-disulfide isomerase|nr:thioredoxin domain-containing protein [Pyrinomonadaceae bacterium]